MLTRMMITLGLTLCATTLIPACDVEEPLPDDGIADTSDSDNTGNTGETDGDLHVFRITALGDCYIGSPDYPECVDPDGSTIPEPTCDNKPACYCVCRYSHQCWHDPSECNALADCLDSCDASFPPHCPYPTGPATPTSPFQCF